MSIFRLILIFLCGTLFVLSGVLLSKLIHANNEEAHFRDRIEELTIKEEQLKDKFQLKQDYMRKMISDADFIEQIIRQKTGLSKPNEIIFKFDD